MNIFVPAYINLNEQNAGTTHILELVQNLEKQNNSVTLFASKAKDDKFHRFVSIPKVNIPVINQLVFQIGLFIAISFKVLINRPDIIYYRKFQFILVPIILKITGIPYVLEVNGSFIEEIKLYKKYPSIYIYISKIIDKLNYTSANKIVVVTSLLKDELIEKYGIDSKKIVVIENGANINHFKPIDKNQALLELNYNIDNKYVCFIGNLAPWQGLEYLIHAASGILKTCPDARFLIIGDGPMKNEWMQFTQELEVSENFIFTGSIPYEQIPLYINASDVCVVTKRQLKSGYSPLKLYEYMACSKPVIATRTDGFEILEECNAGILINPINTHELVDAVVKLLQNENLRKKMGTNGRKYVVENHSWASVAKKVAHACEDIIAEHNKYS